MMNNSLKTFFRYCALSCLFGLQIPNMMHAAFGGRRRDDLRALNLSKEATIPEIKKRFAELALQLHPDKCTNQDSDKKARDESCRAFIKIKEARDRLLGIAKEDEDENVWNYEDFMERMRERDAIWAEKNSQREREWKIREAILRREEDQRQARYKIEREVDELKRKIEREADELKRKIEREARSIALAEQLARIDQGLNRNENGNFFGQSANEVMDKYMAAINSNVGLTKAQRILAMREQGYNRVAEQLQPHQAEVINPPAEINQGVDGNNHGDVPDEVAYNTGTYVIGGALTVIGGGAIYHKLQKKAPLSIYELDLVEASESPYWLLRTISSIYDRFSSESKPLSVSACGRNWDIDEGLVMKLEAAKDSIKDTQSHVGNFQPCLMQSNVFCAWQKEFVRLLARSSDMDSMIIPQANVRLYLRQAVLAEKLDEVFAYVEHAPKGMVIYFEEMDLLMKARPSFLENIIALSNRHMVICAVGNEVDLNSELKCFGSKIEFVYEKKQHEKNIDFAL